MLSKTIITASKMLIPYPPVLILYIIWKLYIKELIKQKRRIEISIIGMSGSGKTYLFDKIRGENRCPEGQTSEEKLDSKIIKVGDVEIELKPTWDISGEKSGMEEQFENLCKTCDIMIGVFDVSKFLNDKAYRKDFAQRVKAISIKMNPQKTLLLGSHLDKILSLTEKEAKRQIKKYATEEEYTALEKMIKNSPLVIGNLTDEEWIDKFKKDYIFQNLLKK